MFMKKVFALAICLCMAALAWAQLPKVASGRLVRHENFASRYVQPRTVDVWLPATYDGKKRHAVLYMHDGQMLFDSTTTWNKQEWGVDEILGRLIAEGQVPGCIVVAVRNGGPLRHSEYFPQKPFEALPAAQRDSLMGALRNGTQPLFAAPVQSDKYLKFLVEELKPFIDRQYATKPQRAHTFVAGASMGGLISMYALCEYPKVFGGAACLSTHWPGIFATEGNPVPAAFMAYLEKNLPAPKHHKIYFDLGTAALDAMYPPLQRQADEVMRRRQYPESLWITRTFEGEDHSERAWQKRLHIPLLFLMGKK